MVTVARVLRELDDNSLVQKTYDPSLRIHNPGKLGMDALAGKAVDARLAEQSGWVAAADIDPRLLLASMGGYDKSMQAHVNSVSPHEKQRVCVVPPCTSTTWSAGTTPPSW